MYAIERRTPTTLAHRGRQAGKVVLYTATTAALTLAVVLVAAIVAIADARRRRVLTRRRPRGSSPAPDRRAG